MPRVIRPKDCYDCGGELVFDPEVRGYTCGGLALKGWDVCSKCGKCWLARHGAEECEMPWRLASGDRSVDTGHHRISTRGVGAVDDVVALMHRIVRLPELEAALADIAQGEGASAERARRALYGEPIQETG